MVMRKVPVVLLHVMLINNKATNAMLNIFVVFHFGTILINKKLNHICKKLMQFKVIQLYFIGMIRLYVCVLDY